MWLRRIASRRATSIDAVAIWPVVIAPSVMRAMCRRRFGRAYVVSSTSAAPRLGRDRARVADLTARLGVERGALEEQLDQWSLGPIRPRRRRRPGPGSRRCSPNSRRTRWCRTAPSRRGRRRASRRRRRPCGRPWPGSAARSSSVSKPAWSTATPRSPAISWVSSSGNPYVSCSRNAVDPDSANRRHRRVHRRGSTARSSTCGGSAPPPCR